MPLLLLLLTACNESGTRVPDQDGVCSEALPAARSFDDLSAARERGCDEVRVHRGKLDPATGETQDFEDLVFCCAK